MMKDQLDLFEDPTNSYFETRSFTPEDAKVAYTFPEEVNTLTVQYPKDIAFWVPVYGVKFGIRRVPNKFHRFMMKLLMGWEFEEIPQQSSSKKQLLLG